MIVLADKKAVHDLLDKKGNIYSDRPSDFMTHLTKVDQHIIFLPMNTTWRLKRKTVSHNFSPRMLDEKHFEVQEAELVPYSLSWEAVELKAIRKQSKLVATCAS